MSVMSYKVSALVFLAFDQVLFVEWTMAVLESIIESGV